MEEVQRIKLPTMSARVQSKKRQQSRRFRGDLMQGIDFTIIKAIRAKKQTKKPFCNSM